MDDRGAVPHPLSDNLAERIAQCFRALGEPMRIRLLDQLRAGEASVGTLQAAVGGSQQNVSKHLVLLYRMGLVSREKRGTSVFYAIADGMVFELCELVCGRLRQQHAELGGALQEGLPLP